jgi:hypothetical protein
MKALPTHHFFIVNRNRKAVVRYQAAFLPRVGDTIAIEPHYLKVVDVVILSAQMDGGGAPHSVYVHTKECKAPFDASSCEELEMHEFCGAIKGKSGATVRRRGR